MEMHHALDKPTSEDIKALNDKLGFEVPKVYSDFLLEYGGGQIEDNLFKSYENGEVVWEFYADVLFGIHKEFAYDLYSNYMHYRRRLPKDVLPIGSDGIGNIICIGISESNYGKIFIGLEPDDPYEDNLRVESVTETFGDFLAGLVSDYEE